MTKLSLAALVALIVFIGGLYIATTPAATVDTTATETHSQPQQQAPQGKLMSVESYVTQNISSLSPIKETMGGTFYVTEIEVEPEENKGKVKYEDGHNAYEAEFTYTSSDQTGHTITSFVIKN